MCRDFACQAARCHTDDCCSVQMRVRGWCVPSRLSCTTWSEALRRHRLGTNQSDEGRNSRNGGQFQSGQRAPCALLACCTYLIPERQQSLAAHWRIRMDAVRQAAPWLLANYGIPVKLPHACEFLCSLTGRIPPLCQRRDPASYAVVRLQVRK